MAEGRGTTPDERSTLVYFGCWDQPGHHWHDDRGRRIRRSDLGDPWGSSIDRSDMHCGPEGTRYLLHLDGWTALDITDRTVDTRPGSHSAFLAPALLTEQQMVTLACAAFPRIAERIGLTPPARESS